MERESFEDEQVAVFKAGKSGIISAAKKGSASPMAGLGNRDGPQVKAIIN